MPTQQENRSNKPVRMVAVDMDGTFLNDDKTFDVERFERILTRLSRHGIYFVVASGNTYTKLRQYMHGFEHRDIIYIAENGAYLADDSGELAVHHFDTDDLPRVYEILSGMPQLGVIVCTAGSSFMLESREKTVMNIIRDYFEVQGKPLPHRYQLTRASQGRYRYHRRPLSEQVLSANDHTDLLAPLPYSHRHAPGQWHRNH